MAQTGFKQWFLENPLGSADLVLNGIGFHEKMIEEYILAIHREAVRLRPDAVIVRNPVLTCG